MTSSWTCTPRIAPPSTPTACLPDLEAPTAVPLDDVLLDLLGPPVVCWPGGPTLTLRAPEAQA